MKTIFSGVQPTGSIHLGNYLGAIKNWVSIIKTTPNAQFFFSIADLHAITIYQDPQSLRDAILQTFAMYVACGIYGENITVFQQSAVRQHAELAWALSCNIQTGFLNRMTQYKEKAWEKERACLGLYSYPVLMAADILLYKTNLVPVGEDQIQHVELTREIASKFNSKYSQSILTVPDYVLTKSAKRIMSLRDAKKKMSKSDESDFSRINLLDDTETILKKIQKAKSGDAEIQNLANIYKAITGLELTMEDGKSAVFKQAVADAIIMEILPIQKKFHELMNDRTHIISLLAKGAERAGAVAESNLNEIYKVIGLR